MHLTKVGPGEMPRMRLVRARAVFSGQTALNDGVACLDLWEHGFYAPYTLYRYLA